jgi:two-component system, OmpR family, sensor histidine kinase KdpD
VTESNATVRLRLTGRFYEFFIKSLYPGDAISTLIDSGRCVFSKRLRGLVSRERVMAVATQKTEKLGPNMTIAKVNTMLRPFRGAALGSAVVLLLSFCAYRLHFNLSAAASLDILIVFFITLWFGFWQATATSFAAVACLAYFFAPPILSFYVDDPHNWVALAVFELTALLVSQLSTQAHNQKRRAVLLHDNATRLYDFSRSILMLNRKEPPGPQIASLIQKNIGAHAVVIFDATSARLYAAGSWTQEEEELARSTYFQNTNWDRKNASRWQRVLHNGSQPFGGLVLSGDRLSSLMVDAIASLVTVAFERAHSLEKEMQAEAERQSERFRTTVLDGLAHAFKTPLTVILASTSGLIETGRLTEAQAELVGLIDQHANRLSGLTNHCLRMAKLESAAIKLRPDDVEISSLVEEIAADCCDQVGKHSIRVHQEGGGLTVSGDRPLLAMTITELIINAAKYSSVGSPITISVLESGEQVVVSVHNQGSMLDPSEQRRIFERFYRSPVTKHGAPGSGIGLSVAKRTAEAHHGNLWVNSDEMTGTTFFLSLPAIERDCESVAR